MDFDKLFFRLQKIYRYMVTVLHLPLPPLYAFFELTYRCNLRCEFCAFGKLLEENSAASLRSGELSAAKICEIIDEIPGFTLITFTGGEPLIKEEFLDIVEHAARTHRIHLVTNGTLITKEMAQRLMALRMKNFMGKGLFWIGVSLEGGPYIYQRLARKSDSFSRTIAGIKALQKYRIGHYPVINLQVMIDQVNLTSLPSTIEMAHELGIKVCNFMVNNRQDHFNRLHQEKKWNEVVEIPILKERELRENLDLAFERARDLGIKIRCQLGNSENIVAYYTNKLEMSNFVCDSFWSTLGISAYGEVIGCFNTVLGSFHDQSLREIWRGERRKRYTAKIDRNNLSEKCQGCCMLTPEK